MKRLMIWCLLTEKRLLKKISYIVVLLIVPVLIWGLRQGAKEEAGMVNVGLCTSAEKGSFSDQLVSGFMEGKSVLRYLRYDSEEEAIKALKENKVDAVWIFPEDLDRQLRELAERKRMRPVVRVVEREDDVALTFTREVLCSRIYPAFVYEAYVSYVKKQMGEDAFTEEEFREIYDEILWKGNLFQAESIDGSLAEENYFMAPMRGLLAIWMVLAGFAALMYHKMDERNGLYDAIPKTKRLSRSFGLQAVVLINCGIIYLIACKILGVFTGEGRELLTLVLFQVCIAAFCNLIGLLAGKVERIGVLIPFMVLLMVALCPIFIDLRQVGAVRAILPPYFYLKAIYATEYLGKMALYGLLGIMLCLALNSIYGKRMK